MTTLVISNCSDENVGDLSGFSAETRYSFGWGAQRMLWYVRDGDIVVLPAQPDETFLNYVTGLTRTDPKSLTFLVPPPGDYGADIVTRDRITSPELVAALRDAARGRTVTDVVSCYADSSIARLVQDAGIGDALSGCRFVAESGVLLANSKSVFRAVAAAADLPMAPGTVVSRPHQAVAAIDALLSAGHHAIVKVDVAAGGTGNEILSPVPGVRAQGAKAVVVLTDRAAIERYVEERWSWLTGGKDDRLVIERFLPGATTVYAEFTATDDGCRLSGMGEILMEPTAVGEIIPPQSVGRDVLDRLLVDAQRICDRFQYLGYRGNICADAIVAPDGEILFTETNGRLTGSSHLHRNLVARVVGPDHRDDRVFLERGWALTATSYPQALADLAAAGLAFDPETRTGVVLTANYVPASGKVTYCVIEKDLAAVRAVEKQVLALSAPAAH
jgi:hypothetical protein